MKKDLIYRYPLWQKIPKFILDSVLLLNFVIFIVLGAAVVAVAFVSAVSWLLKLSISSLEKFISSLDSSHYIGGVVAVILGFVLIKECMRKFKDWVLPLEVVRGKITAVKEEYTASSDSGADSWFVYIGNRSWEIPDRIACRLSKGQSIEIHATACYKEVRRIFLLK